VVFQDGGSLFMTNTIDVVNVFSATKASVTIDLPGYNSANVSTSNNPFDYMSFAGSTSKPNLKVALQVVDESTELKTIRYNKIRHDFDALSHYPSLFDDIEGDSLPRRRIIQISNPAYSSPTLPETLTPSPFPNITTTQVPTPASTLLGPTTPAFSTTLAPTTTPTPTTLPSPPNPSTTMPSPSTTSAPLSPEVESESCFSGGEVFERHCKACSCEGAGSSRDRMIKRMHDRMNKKQ